MNKKRIRAAPSFQEYASDMLANKNFRLMTLPERGLLNTMRLECWCNKSIPASPTELASYLGLSEADLASNLTTNILAFFKEDAGTYFCPELELYREHIESRYQAQAEGGRKGGLTTQSNRKSTSSAKGNLKLLSRDELNGVELNRIESSTIPKSNDDIEKWVNDFDESKFYGINEYAKISRGE